MYCSDMVEKKKRFVAISVETQLKKQQPNICKINLVFNATILILSNSFKR